MPIQPKKVLSPMEQIQSTIKGMNRSALPGMVEGKGSVKPKKKKRIRKPRPSSHYGQQRP